MMVLAIAIVQKRRVLCNSKPYYQDCWHTDLVGQRCWLLRGRPSGRRGSYARLIELTLSGSKRHKGDELLATDLAVYAKISFLRENLQGPIASLWLPGSIQLSALMERWLSSHGVSPFSPRYLPVQSLHTTAQVRRWPYIKLDDFRRLGIRVANFRKRWNKFPEISQLTTYVESVMLSKTKGPRTRTRTRTCKLVVEDPRGQGLSSRTTTLNGIVNCCIMLSAHVEQK